MSNSCCALVAHRTAVLPRGARLQCTYHTYSECCCIALLRSQHHMRLRTLLAPLLVHKVQLSKIINNGLFRTQAAVRGSTTAESSEYQVPGTVAQLNDRYRVPVGLPLQTEGLVSQLVSPRYRIGRIYSRTLGVRKNSPCVTGPLFTSILDTNYTQLCIKDKIPNNVISISFLFSMVGTCSAC